MTRRFVTVLGSAFALIACPLMAFAVVAPQHLPLAELPDAGLGDIVVRARKGGRPPRTDAVGYYQRYCYEAHHRTGGPSPPFADPDWRPLDASTRLRFGITDPDTSAFELVDAGRRHSLLLKFERLLRPGNLVESRCTLVVIGGRDHDRLAAGLSAVFHTPATQRHVGHADGALRLTGWRQWLWSAMPGRESRDWRTINAADRSSPAATWVVVTDLSFYDDHDYVLGDLKTRQDGDQALSMLSFAHITRARPHRSDRNGVS